MTLLRLLLAALLASPLAAQPSLKALWARHETLVLGAPPPEIPRAEASIHLFTGARGQQVRGWEVGDPALPTVLWWEGGPGGWTENPDLGPWLGLDGRKFRFLTLDQPGVGDGTSAWIPGWRPEDTADDAAAFLRLRGVGKPVIVVGWSWGSTMALLFAQRHPELVQAVIVGGVWANSPGEVRRYLGVDGARAFIPGLVEAFEPLGLKGDWTACDLHAALREGRGGVAAAKAYADAEGVQCFVDTPLRGAPLPPLVAAPGTAVDMATCPDPGVRFAYIESEMMCRGERGEWQLPLRFPPQLGKVPLVVIQGRFDQVCDPEVAFKVFKAWPGARKRWVPLNTGHGSSRGLGPEELARVGLDPALGAKVNQALRLRLGHTGRMVGAALSLLVE